jgi:hypothetical protein
VADGTVSGVAGQVVPAAGAALVPGPGRPPVSLVSPAEHATTAMEAASASIGTRRRAGAAWVRLVMLESEYGVGRREGNGTETGSDHAATTFIEPLAAGYDTRLFTDLFARLAELGPDRMVVFICHRFATVRRADQILVLLDGRVAESGTHEDLMALGGVYAELYTMQAEQFG